MHGCELNFCSALTSLNMPHLCFHSARSFFLSTCQMFLCINLFTRFLWYISDKQRVWV